MSDITKGVILYPDLIHTIRKMPKEKVADLFLTILEYANGEQPVIEDVLVDLVFEPIKRQIDRDSVKYEEKISKKSEGGRLGNLKRWNIDLYQKVLKEEINLEEAENIAKARIPIKPIANIAITDTITNTITDTITINKLNTVSASRKSNKKIFKVETPKEIQLPFETENFKSIWKVWNEYRWNEKGQRFKSVDSEHAQLKHLFELSGGNESDAIAIINQSIGNQYTGLFQLKTKPISNAKNNGTTASNSQPWRNQ